MPNKNRTCTMLVVAAGRGRRFGDPLPKQYLPLCGMPVILHTLHRLHRHPQISRIVPVIGPDDGPLWQEYVGSSPQLPKLSAPVFGGAERQDSVYNGLCSLSLADDAWVAIHDGVRPLVPLSLLDRLLAAIPQADGVIAALPANDTVKQCGPDHHIHHTLDRRQIWLAQTPQLFRYGTIRRAHEEARRQHHLGTDDAALLERLEIPVMVVPGDWRNLKITRPEDLRTAACFLHMEEE